MKKTVVTLMATALFLSCSEEDTNNRPADMPVKITKVNSNGSTGFTHTLQYDSQGRIVQITTDEANNTLDGKAQYLYLQDKVIIETKHDDPQQPLKKSVYTHNNGKIVKEEFYRDGQLNQQFVWTNDAPDAKTAVEKDGNGTVLRIYSLGFSPAGNCHIGHVDETDPSKLDFTIKFEGYDSNPRAMLHHNWMDPWKQVPGIFTDPAMPNNPLHFTLQFDGRAPHANFVYEYQYTATGKVASFKTLDANNGNALLNTTYYEY